MNKTVILIGVAALAGVGVWMFMRNRQGAVAGNIITPWAEKLPNLGQPAQNYPFVPNSPPRNDNQSAPWYGQSRSFDQNPTGLVDVNFMKNLGYVKGSAEIVSSLSSIWDDLGVAGWFGSDDATAFDMSEDVFAGGSSFDWGSIV